MDLKFIIFYSNFSSQDSQITETFFQKAFNVFRIHLNQLFIIHVESLLSKYYSCQKRWKCHVSTFRRSEKNLNFFGVGMRKSFSHFPNMNSWIFYRSYCFVVFSASHFEFCTFWQRDYTNPLMTLLAFHISRWKVMEIHLFSLITISHITSTAKKGERLVREH